MVDEVGTHEVVEQPGPTGLVDGTSARSSPPSLIDERQRYRRLVGGPVERRLVRDADVAVLVVAPVDAP